MTQIAKMFSGKCPHCEKGTIFYKNGNPILFQMPKMHSHCPVCDFKFEREPGYFFGAMYVSYALAVAEMVALFVISRLFVSNLLHSFMIMAGCAFFLTTLNFKYSRLIWLYLFEGKSNSI